MKRSMVLVVLLSLLAVLGATAGVVSLSSPTTQVKTAALIAAPSLVDLGKSALAAHDILTARQNFSDAVAANPGDQEANLLLGITRIFAIFEDGQNTSTSGLDSVREIFELSGFSFQTFGLYNIQGSDPKQPASTTPRTGAVLDFVKNKVLPEVDAAIANLAAVTNTGFSSSVSPAAYNSSGSNITIDYADAQVVKALLQGLKCNLNLLMVYGLDVYVPDIAANPKQLTTYKNLFSDPNFLAVKDASRLTTAKAALISFIDTYTAAVPLISATSRGAGHLFVVDSPVYPITNEPVDMDPQSVQDIASTLADVKASLSGPKLFQGSGLEQDRTVDLSKFFNAASPIVPRSQVANCSAPGTAPADGTIGGLFPLGFSKYAQIKAQNGADILGVACTGYETPKLDVDQYSLYLSESPWWSTGPQQLTISNIGTAPLTTTSPISLSGPNAADFNLTLGSCSSLTPILAAGQSCSVVVDLKRPFTRSGSGYANLLIASNDAANPTYSVPVSDYLTPTTGGSISGLVRDSKTGAGISGISVNLYDAATGSFIKSTGTNETGGYVLNGLNAGNYKIFYAVSSWMNLPYQSKWYDGKLTQGSATPVSLATSSTNLTNVNMALSAPPVTLQWGAVWHRTLADGSQVDVLDAAINSDATTLSGLTLKVDGPPGFTSYTFTEADKIPYLNGRFSLYKAYPSLPAGVYTFTLTDANGNVSYRVSRRVPTPATPPMVDTSTVRLQRKGDGSYRISWAPVNATKTYYYRVRVSLADSASTPVHFSTRNPTAFVDVPQGTGANPLRDGVPHKLRVEVMDAPSSDLTTGRTDSGWVNFTPQPSDYNPAKLLTNMAFMENRTDSDGSASTAVDLQVNNPAAVTLVELRNAGGLVYSFLPSDRSGQEFYAKIKPTLAPGPYTLHYVANGLDHYASLTLTTPVSYPVPPVSTMQAEDQGNGFVRFSFANVNQTGPLYYRIMMQNKTTGETTFTSPRLNFTFGDVAKNSLGDLSNKQWRVEVFDSPHGSTVRNRFNGPWVNLALAPFDPARPNIKNLRMHSLTNSAGVTRYQTVASAIAPLGTLSKLEITDPVGAKQDLLVAGRYQPAYGGFVLETASAPAAGLYTVTATDAVSSATSVRYFTVTAPHAIPAVDFTTFKTNVEPSGDTRISWAPVASDLPVWYQVNLHNSNDANGDQLLDAPYNVSGGADVNFDGNNESIPVYPGASLVVPASTNFGMFRVTAYDAAVSQIPIAGTSNANLNVFHNASQSAFVKFTGPGSNYGALSDADADGWASDIDTNDNSGAAYPFSIGNDGLALAVSSPSPANLATNVFPTASICANFNKMIDQKTLAGNFTVSGVSGSVTFQPGGNSPTSSGSIVCLIPSAPLASRTTFSASIGTGVKDLAGNPLSAPYTWSFSTAPAPGVFANPPGGSFATAPSVALSTNAAGATIYYTTDGSTPMYPTTGTSTQVYNGTPIGITGNTTLSFFARDPGFASGTVSTEIYTLTPPAAPAWLQVVPGAGQASLSWAPSAGADRYNVYLTGVSSPTQATGTTFKDALNSGFYWLDSVGDNGSFTGTVYFASSKVTLNPDQVTLSETYSFWDTTSQVWGTTPPPGFTPGGDLKTKLTPGGWAQVSDDFPQSLAFNGDGSVTATGTGDSAQQRLTLSVVDVSGVPIGSGGSFIPTLPGALVFPAGSKRYDMTQTQLTDSYQTNNSWVPNWISSLDQLPGYFASFPIYLNTRNGGGTSGLQLFFNYSGNSVSIYQQNYSTNQYNLIGTGSWEMVNVYGQQLLVVHIPQSLRASYGMGPEPFYAFVNGVLTAGEHKTVGDVETQSTFNKTAMDHLKTNLSPMLLRNTGYWVPPIAQTTATSFVQPGLQPGMNYSYQVTALNARGEGGFSPTASTTVSAAASDPSAPSVSFTMPGAYGSTTVPILSIAKSDNVAVSAFFLSESSATPAAGAAGWLTTTPQSFTFSGTGTRTLYIWAKDLAGNVSASAASATVKVDQSAPTVTLSVSPTSSSLTVALSLSANDNGGSGVTGYLLNETGAVPNSGTQGWSPSAPTSFTFSGPGNRTLYAYAIDAAGNVGAKSAPVSINLSFQLSVTNSGNGGGTVTSIPVGISCLTGSGAGCSNSFASGSSVTLTQLAWANSTFTGWSGATCSGTAPCVVPMDGNKSVTATFSANPATVRIEGVATYYYNVGGTLDLIGSAGQVVRARDNVFVENVIMTSPVEILLKGGFTDGAFSLRGAGSATVIDGSLKIRRGALRVERLTVR